MKKRICAFLSALALAFSVPLPVSAEEYTYPKMADDYFALVEEYPDYFRMQDNSVYFMAHSFLSNPALIVCSENQFTVQDVNYGYVFMPEESGRYVVTLEETTLDSVAYGDVIADVQYKRYYSYLVEVKNGETTVTCQDLYHPDETVYDLSSCVTDGGFYSFVNGMLPNVETGNDRYFTTIYENNKVSSLFCLSYPYSEETRFNTISTSDKTVAGHSMSLSAKSAPDAGDRQMVYIASASSDGEVTLTANEKEEYDLIVENGVFRYRYEPDIQPYRMGDVNDDGEFNVADAVLLQKWLLAVPDTHLVDWKTADFCNDNKLDVFDLCLMKRELIKKIDMSYVKPEIELEYGPSFYVRTDKLKLYLAPDESSKSVATIPSDTNLIEHGFQKDIDKWLFTRYNGQYGWIKTVDDEGQPTIYYAIELEYEPRFYVWTDKLKLYLAPDESSKSVATIPSHTNLIEYGFRKDIDKWLFTRYNGQCGWIKTVDDEGQPTIYYDVIPISRAGDRCSC
ncbi:MAG TPA: dockerin type I repeat-containing protein [Ruminococcus flavefaciens]|nr:dockerin type I repeat-containing protein [Ruminococcus flavefaciens]